MAVQIETAEEVVASDQVRIKLAHLNRLGFGKSDKLRPGTGNFEKQIWSADTHYLVDRERWESGRTLPDGSTEGALRNAFDEHTGLPYFVEVPDDHVMKAAAPVVVQRELLPEKVAVVDARTGKNLGFESYTAEA